LKTTRQERLKEFPKKVPIGYGNSGGEESRKRVKKYYEKSNDSIEAPKVDREMRTEEPETETVKTAVFELTDGEKSRVESLWKKHKALGMDREVFDKFIIGEPEDIREIIRAYSIPLDQYIERPMTHDEKWRHEDNIKNGFTPKESHRQLIKERKADHKSMVNVVTTETDYKGRIPSGEDEEPYRSPQSAAEGITSTPAREQDYSIFQDQDFVFKRGREKGLDGGMSRERELYPHERMSLPRYESEPTDEDVKEEIGRIAIENERDRKELTKDILEGSRSIEEYNENQLIKLKEKIRKGDFQSKEEQAEEKERIMNDSNSKARSLKVINDNYEKLMKELQEMENERYKNEQEKINKKEKFLKEQELDEQDPIEKDERDPLGVPRNYRNDPRRETASKEEDAEYAALDEKYSGQAEAEEAEEKEFRRLHKKFKDKVDTPKSLILEDGSEVLISDTEADLGDFQENLRLRHSIEGEKSNRAELLRRSIPDGKLTYDESSGEFYVFQEGEWRPVNKDGISVADFAELVGVLPYVPFEAMAISTLGPIGHPVGAVAGNRFRKVLSTMAGNPQVASKEEELKSLGFDVALGLGSSAVSKYGPGVVRATAKRATPYYFKGIKKSLRKKYFYKPLRMLREYDPWKKTNMLKEAARDFDLPKPTRGQKSGDRGMLELEKIVAEQNPWSWGYRYRKNVEKTLKGTRKYLKRHFGKISSEGFDPATAGKEVKTKAKVLIDTVRKEAGDLFEKVEKSMRQTDVDMEIYHDELAGLALRYNILDIPETLTKKVKEKIPYGGVKTVKKIQELRRVPHKTTKELEPEAYKQVQEVLFNVISDVREGLRGKTRLSILDVRKQYKQVGEIAQKVLDSNGGKVNKHYRVLRRVQDEMLGAMGASIEETVHTQKEILKGARVGSSVYTKAIRNVKKYTKIMSEFEEARVKWTWSERAIKKMADLGLDKKGLDAADDKFLPLIFGNLEKTKMLEEVVGKKEVRNAAVKNVNNFISKKMSGQGPTEYVTAGSIKSHFQTNRGVYNHVFGSKKVGKLVRLLEFDSTLKFKQNTSGSGRAVNQTVGDKMGAFLGGFINWSQLKLMGGVEKSTNLVRKQGVRALTQDERRQISGPKDFKRQKK